MATTTTSVSMTDAETKQFENMAKNLYGCTKAEMIRSLVRGFIKSNTGKTVFDINGGVRMNVRKLGKL